MSNIGIYVVAGGHIFVGVVQDDNEQHVVLGPWRQFSRLGTTDLCSGVADGPLAQTKLMATSHRMLRIRADHVRFRVDAGEKWASHLE